MPLVRSINILADGFDIVLSSGAIKTVTSADLTPAQQALSLAQVETLLNTVLAAKLPSGMFTAVHITSIVPLLGTMIVSNAPPTGLWWL